MPEAHMYRLPNFSWQGWYVKGKQHLHWQAKVIFWDMTSEYIKALVYVNF